MHEINTKLSKLQSRLGLRLDIQQFMKHLFFSFVSFYYLNLALASVAVAQTEYECKIGSVSDVFAAELQSRPVKDSSLILERHENPDSKFSLSFAEENLALNQVLQIDEEDWRGAFRVTWFSETSGQVFQITVNSKTGEGWIASHLETGDLQTEVTLSECQLKERLSFDQPLRN